MGNEKKIEKYKKLLLSWLDDVENLEKQICCEKNDKKIAKLNKKLDSSKAMVLANGKNIGKEGGDIQDLFLTMSENQKRILKELLPYGMGAEDLENQKNRSIIINRHKKKIIKIQEARSKYPAYDPELSTKEKLENKIYKLEKSLGRDLYIESDKERVSYQRDWNYLEHMEETKEFTEEEREIMDRCYKIGEEYDTYWMEKFERIGEAAQSLGDKTQARVWCRNIRNDICVPFIKRIYPNKYTSSELEYESKEMTKRCIEFMLSEKEHEPFVRIWEELYEAEDLKNYNMKEKQDIVINIMSEKAGAEKSLFTYLYIITTENQMESLELIGNYTYEELGLE